MENVKKLEKHNWRKYDRLYAWRRQIILSGFEVTRGNSLRDRQVWNNAVGVFEKPPQRKVY